VARKIFGIAVLVSAGLAGFTCMGMAGTVWDLEGALGWGYDTNINRLSILQDEGGYFPFQFLAQHSHSFVLEDRLQSRARGKGRLYTSPNQDFNETKLGVDVRYDRRLVGGQRGKVRVPSLDFHAKVTAEVRNTTYYSRTTGQEIIVVGPDGPTLLGDRYNSRRYYLYAGLVYHQPRGTRWSAVFRLQRRDYINDYEDLPTVDSLDYSNLQVTLKVRQKISGSLKAELRYQNRSTDYDAWRARDFDGNKVAGEYQAFRYNVLAARAEADIGNVGRGIIEVYSQKRDDPFQGYYDYSQWGIAPRLDLDPEGPLSLSLRYRYFHRTYDRARVRFNPVRPLREDFENRFESYLEFATGDNSHVFWNLIHDNVREVEPLYTYTRLRTSAGFAMSF